MKTQRLTGQASTCDLLPRMSSLCAGWAFLRELPLSGSLPGALLLGGTGSPGKGLPASSWTTRTPGCGRVVLQVGMKCVLAGRSPVRVSGVSQPSGPSFQPVPEPRCRLPTGAGSGSVLRIPPPLPPPLTQPFCAEPPLLFWGCQMQATPKASGGPAVKTPWPLCLPSHRLGTHRF